MESKTKLFGHPVHPMLVVLPLGLFIGAVIVDTIDLYTGSSALAQVSFFNIMVGILGGLLAALFGFLDWRLVPLHTRAKQIGAWHGIGNVVVVLMFGVSWWLRRENINYEATPLALAFSYGAILLGVLTAWLGGELVYRLNVGVDNGANLDAPSSLSDKPAASKPATSSTRKVAAGKQQAASKPARR
jgi:uncharacterized membrane protein